MLGCSWSTVRGSRTLCKRLGIAEERRLTHIAECLERRYQDRLEQEEQYERARPRAQSPRGGLIERAGLPCTPQGQTQSPAEIEVTMLGSLIASRGWGGFREHPSESRTRNVGVPSVYSGGLQVEGMGRERQQSRMAGGGDTLEVGFSSGSQGEKGGR